MKNALIIGSQGTIGEALTTQLSQGYQVFEINQKNCDYSESSLLEHQEKLSSRGAFTVIACCIGTLHNDIVAPEKRLAEVTEEKLMEYFRVNTVLPGLCIKTFYPLLDKHGPSQLVCLSAMVGSIGDNNLGGWYGYRSSKAALNMLIKGASIEVRRSHKQSCLAAIHPGTTQGPLSKPFAGNVDKSKYYTPQQSAERILSVIESLTPTQTGAFLNWDGSAIPW